MTSIREALKRLLQRNMAAKEDVHDSEFSYAVYWTQLIRGWDADRRRRVHAVVKATINDPDFVPNEFERRYFTPEIDASRHSGASLVALEKVLASFSGEEMEE
ncbi:MAG: hypothetical protein P8Z42_01825 [Anaerolineales bacterium]|jgi:hypothetical protein